MSLIYNLACLPFDLVPSEDWPWLVGSDRVSTTAKPHSDLFVDPSEGGQVAAETQLNAVTLLGLAPGGDFTFQSRVHVGFRSTFDAAVLLLWLDEHHWAKFCFEYSPAGQPMVVSVVCRGVSDDANAITVVDEFVWLRISRVDSVFAFHASTDGVRWQFVRAFALPSERGELLVGFEAQSPTGEGCDVEFSDIRFETVTLADLRDGS